MTISESVAPSFLRTISILCTPILLGILCASPLTAASVRVYPAPKGEELSTNYTVQVEGESVPVYIAKVASADPSRRWKAMDDKAHSADFFDTAAFAYFDMQGPVTVTVTSLEDIHSAKVLPSSLNIPTVLKGKTITLKLAEPKPLTIEINGKWVGALHLFANAPESDVPKPGDPNVIYFGPGIHEVSHMVVTNNQTVYVAGGAVVRGVIRPDEPFQISSYSGLRTYPPTFELQGDHIRFRGRGIVDGGLSTTHARHLLLVHGKDIVLEGVILRDSSTWNMPIRQSEGIKVKNVKILGYRANSDGIDICNSRDVSVENCFIRTLDDLVVVKTDQNQGPAGHIVVKDCVLWNEVAHALSVGAELRENVDDVLFANCDVIHDMGREWTLRIYHCDSARISNVRFENLRIEESPRLLSLWINKAFWSKDDERGHIDGVVFKNISAMADAFHGELQGYDDAHLIENVLFENVMVNTKPLSLTDLKTNAFVKKIVFKQ
jgi:hypothetical protein